MGMIPGPDMPHRGNEAPEAQNPADIESFTSEQVNKDAQQRAQEAKGKVQLATLEVDQAQTKQIQALIERAHRSRNDRENRDIELELSSMGAPAIPLLIQDIFASREADEQPPRTVERALERIVERNPVARAQFIRTYVIESDERSRILFEFLRRLESSDIPLILRFMDGSELNTIYPQLSQACTARINALLDGAPAQERSRLERRLRRVQYMFDQPEMVERGWGIVIGALRADEYLRAAPDQQRKIQREMDRQMREAGEFTPERAVMTIVSIPDRTRIDRVLNFIEGRIGNPENLVMERAGGLISNRLRNTIGIDAPVIAFFQSADRTPQQITAIVQTLFNGGDTGIATVLRGMSPDVPVARRIAIIRGLHAHLLQQGGLRYPIGVRNTASILTMALQQADLAPVRTDLLEATIIFGRYSSDSNAREPFARIFTAMLTGGNTPAQERLRAIEALGFYASERDLPLLRQLLQNRNLPEAERRAVADTLAGLALSLMASASDEPLQDTVRALMAIIGQPQESQSIRQSARSALARLAINVHNGEATAKLRELNPRITGEERERRLGFVRNEAFGGLLALDLSGNGRNAEGELLAAMERMPLDTLIAMVRTTENVRAARRLIQLAEREHNERPAREAIHYSGARMRDFANILLERHAASERTAPGDAGNALRRQIADTLRTIRPTIQEFLEYFEKQLKNLPGDEYSAKTVQETRGVLQQLDRIAPQFIE